MHHAFPGNPSLTFLFVVKLPNACDMYNSINYSIKIVKIDITIFFY